MKITTLSIQKHTVVASLLSHLTLKTANYNLRKPQARLLNPLSLQISSHLRQVSGEVQAARTCLQFLVERPALVLVYQEWLRQNILFRTQTWYSSLWFPSNNHTSRGEGAGGFLRNPLYKNKTAYWRRTCSQLLRKRRRVQSRSCASNLQEDAQRNP